MKFRIKSISREEKLLMESSTTSSIILLRDSDQQEEAVTFTDLPFDSFDTRLSE